MSSCVKLPKTFVRSVGSDSAWAPQPSRGQVGSSQPVASFRTCARMCSMSLSESFCVTGAAGRSASEHVHVPVPDPSSLYEPSPLRVHFSLGSAFGEVAS